MRRVTLDHPSIEGAVLVRDVRSPAGDILARAGMRLTIRSARALREHGVHVGFIEDAACVGLDVAPLVDLAGADEGPVRALRDTCLIAREAVEPLARVPTSRALETLKDLRVVQKMDTTGAMEALRGAIHSLVDRYQSADSSSGFLTERQPVDDLFGHSVGVAALSIRIAAELGFSHGDLVWTGMAAVFHDVGLLMVPEEVRRSAPATRTPGQQRRYEDHTILGEALLRPFEKRGPALPVVAGQHHEHQSGGGYPRGLTGGNRVLRSANSNIAQIALVSEIVAVADRYESLVSGGPGETPLSAAAARHAVAGEAGARLNAEVVARFVDMIPRYPVGTEVILHGGRHEGSRAVVVGQGPERDRPTVRIYATPGGTVTATDVALAAEPAVDLAVADAAAA
ncbi:MAG: HD-GYP domain-containing protein [Dehalococcoidia bacterium]